MKKDKIPKQTKDAIIFYLGLMAVLISLLFKYGVIVAHILSVPALICTFYTTYSLVKKDKQLNRSGIMGLVVNNVLLFIAGLPVGFAVGFLI
jgi:hypothetical protein